MLNQIVAVCLLASFSALVSAVTSSETFYVTNTDDSGDGSLRQAIINANLTSEHDTILFDIPGDGPHIIQPQSALPIINHPLDINGYSEPGARQATEVEAAHIKIVLDGAVAGVASDGLSLEASDSRINGLVIKNFAGDGISIQGNNNLVRGCYLGTNKKGSESRSNGQAGIAITGDGNQIGGAMAGHRNLISSNQTSGVIVFGDDNLFQGNTIGLDISTSIDLGNADSGIVIYGDNNLIGGTEEGEGNVISGNELGVALAQGTGNQIHGNIIGTDKAGISAENSLGNTSGIVVGLAVFSEIGGSAAGSGNLISNNIGPGIEVYSSTNFIQGNLIGTNIDGTEALGNATGVMIYGDGNLLGGLEAGAGNIVSGNNSSGILIRPALASVIVPRLNVVQGNKIGTDISGEFAVANNGPGIYLRDADANIIGGLTDAAANIISGNNENGILVESFDQYLGSHNNVIYGNTIGANQTRVSPIPNLLSGVRIRGAEGTRVGGVLPSAGNFIVSNGADGVTVEDGQDNGILGNAIADNTDLGIDLLDDGVTSNDILNPSLVVLGLTLTGGTEPQPVFDLDTGPHNLQNFPVLEIATTDGLTTSVVVSLHSTPTTDFRLEFFSTEFCDPSGHGEGEVFLGAINITTDSGGTRKNASFVLNVPTPVGHSVVATASEVAGNIAGNTSEFSECLAVL